MQILVAEAYGYLVHYRPYQDEKKRMQVVSSTKQGLGKKSCSAAECLIPAVSFDIFMDNYLTSFCQFTHLRVNYIRATGVLRKNRVLKCTIIWGETAAKRETCPL